MNNDYYFEKCNSNSMLTYPFFLEKLKKVELVSKVLNSDSVSKLVEGQIGRDNQTNCYKCHNTLYYKLSNIIWPSNIGHLMTSHQIYPSEYFSKVILNTTIINGSIVNKPMILNPARVKDFHYVPIYYNKLLIIDALLKQGSSPRYEVKGPTNSRKQFIYSEHSGAIAIKNNALDNIIVYADTNRTDQNDSEIFLPNDNPESALYEYLFHTHPNTTKYAGRLTEGILYEFPSANDIFNFIKYHLKGKAQGSVVVAPEGIYVIRLRNFEKGIKEDKNLYGGLKDLILELERESIGKLSRVVPKLSDLSDPDVFHQKVGSNLDYVHKYNNFLKNHNLYIEYYPREKKNNEWCLRSIALMYVSPAD
jgi:hypothetical protein